MRFETVDAFEYLVSTYTTAIEGTLTRIPEETVELIGTDPLKACEALNELAVSAGAVTPELDQALQALYESMDAEDARSEADPEVCQRCLAAYERVHVEIPEPEPEPEPEESPEAEEAAEDTSEGPKSRKRRQRRQRNRDTEQADAEESTEAETTEAEGASDKPAKKRARKAKKATEEKGAEDAPKESKKAAKAEASSAPFEGDALTVDQALAILGCSRPKLTKMIEAGELPAYKKGRSWQVSAAAVLDKAAGL